MLNTYDVFAQKISDGTTASIWVSSGIITAVG